MKKRFLVIQKTKLRTLAPLLVCLIAAMFGVNHKEQTREVRPSIECKKITSKN